MWRKLLIFIKVSTESKYTVGLQWTCQFNKLRFIFMIRVILRISNNITLKKTKILNDIANQNDFTHSYDDDTSF